MRKSLGLTLLELLIVLAVLAILATMVGPAWNSVVERNRITTHANAFVTAATLARSEATRDRETVLLCASRMGSNPRTCDGNTWSEGWIVISEEARDDGDDPIRVWDAPAGDPLFDIQDGSTEVAFSANGRVDDDLDILLRMGNTDGDVEDTRHCRQLVINASGQARANSEWRGENPCEDED